MNDEELRRYYISYTNMLKVINYRNYHISNKYKLSFESFNKLYKDMNIRELKEEISGMIFNKKTKNKSNEAQFSKNGNTHSDTIILLWHLEPNIGKDVINIHNIMIAENVKKAIVVVDNNITTTCKNIVGMLKKNKLDPITIDFWTSKESMIFVPEHRLVPQHRICSPKEKKEIFKAYGIIYEKPPPKLSNPRGLKKGKIPQKSSQKILQSKLQIPVKKQLPNIKSDDVMVKYLGAIRGQLIEIIRKSDTDPNNSIISYRLVV
jgi:DNA-directed RNA polymerase subunit H (RpoH/RPB5)